ncbi:OmpA family protein [Roseivivax sp. CAU 1753]
MRPFSTNFAFLAVTLLTFSAPLPVQAQSEAECTEDDRIIACFESFSYELRDFHPAQIARIANDIALNYVESNDDRHVITVTGHAATYQDTPQLEYLKNSFGRGITVAAMLRDILQDEYGIGPGQVGVTVASASNGQPRDGMGYATQRQRALQRRVEITGVAQNFAPPPRQRLGEALDEAARNQCQRLVVAQIKDEDQSPVFVASHLLAVYFGEALDPSDFSPYGHKRADQDMRQIVRDEWQNSRDMEADRRVQRLRIRLRNICRDINGVINALPSMACDDPRVVTFRAEFFTRIDDDRTIYAQSPIKERIEDRIDAMDGFFGEIRPELSCL